MRRLLIGLILLLAPCAAWATDITTYAGYKASDGTVPAVAILCPKNDGSRTLVSCDSTDAGWPSGGGGGVAAATNTTKIGGTNISTGAGTADAGSQRTTVGQDTTTIAGSAPGTAGSASTNVITVQGIASATPIIVNQSQVGGATVVADPCQTNGRAYTPISISSAANTKIVTGTSAKKTYLCHLFLFAAAADNVAIVEGTGTNCATGTAGVIGGATTGTGINLVANQGWVAGAGGWAVAATATNADDLCLITSAASQLSGVAVTVQQ